jgi:hypothetical protein
MSKLFTELMAKVYLAVIVALACFLIAAAMGKAAADRRADGLVKDRDAWKAATTAWRGVAGGWKHAYEVARDRRASEAGTARISAAQASIACSVRIAEARRSTAAIDALFPKETPRDPQGCPVRRLADPERVHGALERPDPAGRR